MKLALHIIAKDENAELKRIIKDYGQYFDEIAIAYDFDKAIEGIEPSEKIKLHKYDFREFGHDRLNFDHKRNWLAERTESPYYFRMDTDDSIDHPELIADTFKQAVNDSVDVVYFRYIYAKDVDGNETAKHWRETIIRKDPTIYWKKWIHENILAEDEDRFNGAKIPFINIIHNIDEEHGKISHERNTEYLLAEFKRDGENTDPRTLSYIGRVLTGEGRCKEAVPFLEKLIQKSGWDDDRYFAWVNLAICWCNLGNHEMAIDCCDEALKINTTFPDAYIRKGGIYLTMGQYKKAVDWLMYGLVRPEPDTMFITEPYVYTVLAPAYACMAHIGAGNIEMALDLFERVRKTAPNCVFVKEHAAQMDMERECFEYMKALNIMVATTLRNSPEKMAELVLSVPKKFEKDERVAALRRLYLPPKDWGDKSVCFFCGSTPEEWAAPSILKGVGGSEEAVIYLSHEFQKLGWKVVVYNNCGEMAGDYGGIEYKQYFEFNAKDSWTVLVEWRLPFLKDFDINAKRFLWLHDVPRAGLLRGNEINRYNKVIVLSQYHKSLLKGIPDSKVYVSANGIHLSDFKDSLVARNPKRMIYTSSYDRGISNLLSVWSDVVKEVSDAELHLFYGWNIYKEMEKGGWRDPRERKIITRLMEQPGVFEHGRVGHKQLVKEFQKSGIWVYPCHFEEISCCVGDTPILMPRDHQKYPYGVPVKELVGKKNFPVYAYDHSSGKITLGNVLWVSKTKQNAELLKITLDDGTILRFTPNHQFMLRNGEYKEASNLVVGDSLMPCRERQEKKKNTILHNHKILFIEKDTVREDVYDMEVEKYHNFAAGGVFVHNCISAMKAQACGCVPVCTNYAALSETVKDGVIVEGKASETSVTMKLKDELIKLLKDPDRQEKLRQSVVKHKDSFDWAIIAKDWELSLFSPKRYDLKTVSDCKKVYTQKKEDVKFPNINTETGEFKIDKRIYYVTNKAASLGVKSVLDVGCGDGVTCYLLEQSGISADGVDIDAGCIAAVSEYAKKTGSKCSFFCSEASELKTDKKYDCALFMDVIEHTISPKEALTAVENCVVDGGYVIVTTPDKNGICGDRDDNPQHINLFDEEGLRALIGKDRIIELVHIGDILVAVYKK